MSILTSIDATTNRDKLASNPATLLTGQQEHCIRNILHFSDSLFQSSQREKIILDWLDLGYWRQRVCKNGARGNSVDSDVLPIATNL
jgi:hypothetical protein